MAGIKTKAEAAERLQALNLAISTAVTLIRSEQETLDQFFAESANMDSVGPILDPTLFNSAERQTTEAIFKPIYASARQLIEVFDRQVADAQAALEKVGDRP
ncbi:hypothetical protein [Pelagibacterium montanilacus]|uniref:hypothetical protein n=1 Tax=Pelagibacterium montanilacus TaxID=2185280 RepID=UPI000F8ED6F9|nr:hypothetical protein [Pelagibacterium montanilacus]